MPASENQPEEDAGGGDGAAVCAPRVTIDADGNIVLDEERLVNNSKQNIIYILNDIQSDPEKNDTIEINLLL